MSSVLTEGLRVTLRSNANRSTGGICTDKTSNVHPELVAMAEQIAKTTGLFAIGIDYITTDISLPPSQGHGAFIEVNTTPGLSALAAAGYEEVELAMMVLGPALGPVPVDLHVIPGEEQAGQIEKLKDWQPSSSGEGAVCGSFVRVGDSILNIGGGLPWAAVHAALRNQALENLDIFCTVEEIATFGLPVDQLSRYECCDAALPEEWQCVLQDAVRGGFLRVA